MSLPFSRLICQFQAVPCATSAPEPARPSVAKRTPSRQPRPLSERFKGLLLAVLMVAWVVQLPNQSDALLGQKNAIPVAKATTGYDSTLGCSLEEDPTGLLNEGFRYRDLDSGTFITKDPLGFVNGPNVYTYVNQNPWTKFDPEGLQVMDTIAEFGGDIARPTIQGGANDGAAGFAPKMSPPAALAAPAPAPTPSPTAKGDKGTSDHMVYRAMQEEQQNGQGTGMPQTGADKKTLGPLVGPLPPGGPSNQKPDVTPQNGVVNPGQGGMSVFDSPGQIPSYKKDPTWGFDLNNLPPGLKYVPDPSNPGHGTIQPSAPTPTSNYIQDIHSTQPDWQKVPKSPNPPSGNNQPAPAAPPKPSTPNPSPFA